MKFTRVFLFLAFTFSTLISQAQDVDWFTYHSKKWDYSIEFPEEPEESKEWTETMVGSLKMYVAMYQTEESSYMTSVTSYPEAMLNLFAKAKDGDPFYDGLFNGLSGSLEGTVESQKPIQYGAYKGREARIHAFDESALVTVRVYVIENEVYMIQTMYAIDAVQEENMKRFFDSFKLVED
jgi:hypothetical protein